MAQEITTKGFGILRKLLANVLCADLPNHIVRHVPTHAELLERFDRVYRTDYFLANMEAFQGPLFQTEVKPRLALKHGNKSEGNVPGL